MWWSRRGGAKVVGMVGVVVCALFTRSASAGSEPGPGTGTPPPPLLCGRRVCRHLASIANEHHYSVNGTEIWITYRAKEYLVLNCLGNGLLEWSELPCAPSLLHVGEVRLQACAPPAAGARAATLHAVLGVLNVSLPATLTLRGLPRAPPLSAAHMSGLDRLPGLKLHAFRETRASCERGVLAPLQGLEGLYVENVALEYADLEVPPPLLGELHLLRAGVERLPSALADSPALRTLWVESESALDAGVVPRTLQDLELHSPATSLRLRDAPALQELVLSNWTEAEPARLTRCTRLRRVRLVAPAAHALPDKWLVNCPRLRDVEIVHARRLTTLPPLLFGTQFDLRYVAFKHGVLDELPGKMTIFAPVLRKLELNGNSLRLLPSDMFSKLTGLHELNLSSNALDENALAALDKLQYLKVLDLSSNPRLGDACDGRGDSPLRGWTRLNKLVLRGTNVSHICRDWRENLTLLDTLDLRDTAVAELALEDVQFTREVKVEVLLQGAPINLVRVTREEVAAAAHDARAIFATVHIDGELACDCRMYWARRALDHRLLEHVRGARCAGGRGLRDLDPGEMVCDAPEECAAFERLPAECTCAWRPDEDTRREHNLVRVRCERAGLTRVPTVRASRPPTAIPRLYELLLANNDIAELVADDLRNLKGLDLRNNSLARVSDDTAAALRRVGGELQVAGNPLACDCRAAMLLSALRDRAGPAAALSATTCDDGRTLDAVPILQCAPPQQATPLIAEVVGGIATVLVLLAAVTAYLASRERRLLVKVVLSRWGCWRRAPEREAEDARPYDAFVTFSHQDEAVAVELVRALEPTYRLCVHHRDWTPGRLIGEQIAESVQRSRRTVALVSRNYLASTWAQVEFRGAHAVALRDSSHRLVVVLLEEPSVLPPDPTLQNYLATNTYVQWGDRRLRDKLAVALPPPRPTVSARPALGSAVSLTAQSEPVAVALPPPRPTVSARPALGSAVSLTAQSELVAVASRSSPAHVASTTDRDSTVPFNSSDTSSSGAEESEDSF